MKKPLLTIICITYNHEKFIAQAIEGFLLQKTDFPIEIIIHDDCSTDNTRKIIQPYTDKHPELFKLIYQKENQYSQGKKQLSNLLVQCTGKYIALCEGDDYWTDPNKLQKQVDFLEKNLDYAMCFHNSKVLQNETLVDNYLKNRAEETTTIHDLAHSNYIYTASCLVRNYFSNGLPDFYNSSPAGDYLLWMLAAKNGKIKYIDEVMSVYRVHDGGIWSVKTSLEKLEASALVQKILMENFEGEVKHILTDNYINSLHRIIQSYKDKEKKSSITAHGINNPYYIRENTTLKVIFKALLAKIQLDLLKK